LRRRRRRAQGRGAGPGPRGDGAEGGRRGPGASRARPRPAGLSIEELAATGHELVAPRAGANELDRCAGKLADPLHVVAAALREVVPAPGRADVLLPTGHLLVNRRAVLVVGDVGDRVVVSLASKLVTRADLQERLVVEDVQPHQ